MTVKERIRAIRLSEKIDRQPEFAKKIGVTAETENRTESMKTNTAENEKNC